MDQLLQSMAKMTSYVAHGWVLGGLQVKGLGNKNPKKTVKRITYVVCYLDITMDPTRISRHSEIGEVPPPKETFFLILASSKMGPLNFIWAHMTNKRKSSLDQNPLNENQEGLIFYVYFG